jgi:hypothetical protein
VVNAAPALDTALRTVVPIAMLVGAGVGARATGVLRAGGARVLIPSVRGAVTLNVWLRLLV